MIEWLIAASWSPYLVGAGIGVLIWTVFLLSDRHLGCSTAYSRTAGMIESAISRQKTESMPYYRKIPPTIDWQWMLVVGTIIGSALSAYLSGSWRVSMIPPLFEQSFGTDELLRQATALAGGVLMGLGARWADGCTSGHGISGTLQLSLASWIAVICFFAAGIIAAGLIHGFSFL